MKRYNMNLTCKGLFNRMNKGEINFDCAVQRGLVWDKSKKSLLIHSILYGYTIPAFYLTKNEEGNFDCLDGKQRSNAIYTFINNEFDLDTDFPPVYDDEEQEQDFSGMTFDNLPEWAQDRIKDFSLTVYYFEDITEEETREFFRRLNNGKPLSAVELTRVKAKSIDKFQTLAKHDAIQAAVTEKGKARFADENIAMQVYAFAYMENPDFGTKAFRPFITDAIVSDEQMNRIIKGLDYVKQFINFVSSTMDSKEATRVLKRIKSRTHFVAMTYLGMMSADIGADTATFNAVVYDFFKGATTTTSERYNKTIGAGSARADAVQGRKIAVIDLFHTVENKAA